MVAPVILTCPREECPFETNDRSRGSSSTMGRHIQTSHPTRHRVEWCASCRRDGAQGPNHDASYRCESGWYSHCSCDTCF